MRHALAVLLTLAFNGAAVPSTFSAEASALPRASAAVSDTAPAQTLAPYIARFHRDRPVIAVIGDNRGTELVDFVVPYGVLARSGVATVVAVATREGAMTMRPALRIQPQATIAQFDLRYPEGADYVIVPMIVRREDPLLLAWLNAQATKGSTLVSICDGVMVLAEAGLLQQRRATGHWASEPMRRDMYPQVQWVNNLRYVIDGPLASSAGISAALPMSLAIVEAIGGRTVAAKLAGELGVADWSDAHNSDRFASRHGALLDAAAALQLRNRVFHSMQSVGIDVVPGVDEIALAMTADAYSRTGRSQVIALSSGPVATRNGLTILPARDRDAIPRVDVMLPAFDATPPARTLDQALAGIATRYGRHTANDVASAFEYPRIPQ